MGTNLLLNSQSVGTKLPKCGETHVLIPLFMGVCEEVIEHITDDAYNRQGEFIEWLIYCRKKKNDREKEQSKTNQRAVGLETGFYGVYTFVYKMFVFY